MAVMATHDVMQEDRQELVAEVNALTAAIADNAAVQARLALRRRRLLFRLNREHAMTYRELREATGIASSSLIGQIRRAREEEGAERLPGGRRPRAWEA